MNAISQYKAYLHTLLSEIAGEGQPLAAVQIGRIDDLTTTRSMPLLTISTRRANPDRLVTSGTRFAPQYALYIFARKQRNQAASVVEEQLDSITAAICSHLAPYANDKQYWTRLNLSTPDPIYPLKAGGTVYLLASIYADVRP
ncbi:MAG: hypothetical protein M9928_15610 [Anaerolineae bacterium]|nr:hypothetical protein [Anaerolineae bacterium]MCO5194560.1 hypothetical protein [Anaerolineae bacterium]MCO5199633.1 hypothetical protein [Anaerolineae bacterium]MCO5206463.1 hypothetical protein [Anaerolineae bacterium]